MIPEQWATCFARHFVGVKHLLLIPIVFRIINVQFKLHHEFQYISTLFADGHSGILSFSIHIVVDWLG